MRQGTFYSFFMALMTILFLLPSLAIAKMNMGTINIQVGESRQLTSESSTYFTVSGDWSKTGNAIRITSSSNRSCTIYGVQEGTATVEWMGLIDTTWEEMYWTINVDPEPDPIDDVLVNPTNFPDANFRNWILQQSYGKDGVLTGAEIASVFSIHIEHENISSLKGIECFKNLKQLYCYGCQLTLLDVSQNKLLYWLECGGNKLTNLDVSNNKALSYLRCASNSLESLNVTGIPNLETLDCMSNQLTTLDVSTNTKLKKLQCDYNQLTSLDISKNTALTELECDDNRLTSLDVSNCTVLTKLDCSYNRLTSLLVSNSGELVELRCYDNGIKGPAMDNLITSLPANNKEHVFVVVSSKIAYNFCTRSQVAKAKSIGWTPMKIYGGKLEEYEGSIPLTAINLNKNSIYINVGKQDYISVEKLEPENATYKRVVWSSTETNVAEVRDGYVTAKSPGSTIITCEAFDGSGAVATCSVTVTDPSGISTVMMTEKAGVPIYAPSGQRLSAPRKGINIVGGKKVIVK